MQWRRCAPLSTARGGNDEDHPAQRPEGVSVSFPLYFRLEPEAREHPDFLFGYMTREYLGPHSWTHYVRAFNWAMWDLGWRAACYDITGKAALQ